ncbi:MAG TPA: UDP-3-O-(3-hydroxymyristoyl)glucosamine N-acyltransferase, partial [Pseudomonadales bacterium]
MAGVRRSFTLDELAELVGAEVSGDGKRIIRGLGSLEGATETDISHLSSATYRHLLAKTRAGAVILAPEDAHRWAGDKLLSANPYLAFARISQQFAQVPALPGGVHPSAVIAPSAAVDPSAAIGPGVVIGERSRIGANVRVHANACIGEDCVVAADVTLMPNVVLYADVHIGERGVVHSGAVLGADGFGYTPDARGVLVAIAQLGGVRVGCDVSIGASTTIDRG